MVAASATKFLSVSKFAITQRLVEFVKCNDAGHKGTISSTRLRISLSGSRVDFLGRRLDFCINQ